MILGYYWTCDGLENKIRPKLVSFLVLRLRNSKREKESLFSRDWEFLQAWENSFALLLCIRVVMLHVSMSVLYDFMRAPPFGLISLAFLQENSSQVSVITSFPFFEMIHPRILHLHKKI